MKKKDDIVFEVNATDNSLIALFGGETPDDWYELEDGRVEVGLTWASDGLPIVQEVVIRDSRYVTLIRDWVEEGIIQALPDSFKDDFYYGREDKFPLVESDDEWT